MSHDKTSQPLLARASAHVAAHPFVLPTRRCGRELWVSGQVPFDRNGALVATGTVGDTVTVQTARECARQCALNVLARVRDATASLDQVAGPIRLTVFVAATAHFTDQPSVADAAWEVMLEALGEDGRHARAAVGVASLPLGCPVEVDAVFELLAP